MYKIDKEGDRATIIPDEDIVASNTPDLKEKLLGLMKENVIHLSFNLENVLMVDSSGLGILIATHKSLAKKEGTMEVTNVKAEIKTLFEITKLTDFLTIKD